MANCGLNTKSCVTRAKQNLQTNMTRNVFEAIVDFSLAVWS